MQVEQHIDYKTLSIGALWRNVWGGLNAADEGWGQRQAEAQERHEQAWAELVRRGAARLKAEQGEEMR